MTDPDGEDRIPTGGLGRRALWLLLPMAGALAIVVLVVWGRFREPPPPPPETASRPPETLPERPAYGGLHPGFSLPRLKTARPLALKRPDLLDTISLSRERGLMLNGEVITSAKITGAMDVSMLPPSLANLADGLRVLPPAILAEVDRDFGATGASRAVVLAFEPEYTLPVLKRAVDDLERAGVRSYALGQIVQDGASPVPTALPAFWLLRDGIPSTAATIAGAFRVFR
ncbi:MAG: hypothetical protein GMKNLPBB_00658 [Myxococcota bacterium]|nr:hypothetical protein [Myxococcota bacterium]